MKRLLAVDFNACRRPQQEPYRLLAQRGRLTVRLLMPSAWQESFGVAAADAGLQQPGLELRALPTLFNGRYHRVLFRGLAREVRLVPQRPWRVGGNGFHPPSITLPLAMTANPATPQAKPAAAHRRTPDIANPGH